MNIKFLKGVMHLGYAYRAGDTAGSLPDEVAQKFIDGGYAILNEKRKRRSPKVQTTEITRSKKR